MIRLRLVWQDALPMDVIELLPLTKW